MAINNAVSDSREPPSAGPFIGGNLAFMAVTGGTRICADSRSLVLAFWFRNRLPPALDGGTTTKVFAGFRPDILTSRLWRCSDAGQNDCPVHGDVGRLVPGAPSCASFSPSRL